jgi:hypothetical protein
MFVYRLLCLIIQKRVNKVSFLFEYAEFMHPFLNKEAKQ